MTLKSRIFASLIAMTAVLTLQSLAQAESPPKSILDEPLLWKDDRGEDVRLSKWSGTRVVITMSYTRCTKLCNTLTLKELKEIQARFDEKGEKAEFVIITFDPENDTPGELAAYRKRMNITAPNWHYLVGSKEDTRKISGLLGLDGFWNMDDHFIHDFRILILNPSGQIEHVLDWKHRKVDF